jgi:hypothetical protein
MPAHNKCVSMPAHNKCVSMPAHNKCVSMPAHNQRGSWDAGADGCAPQVDVECEDAPGMLAAMSKAIGTAGVNIGGVVLKKLPEGSGLASFEVIVMTREQMDRVICQLKVCLALARFCSLCALNSALCMCV